MQPCLRTGTEALLAAALAWLAVGQRAPDDQHRAAPVTHLLEQPGQDPALAPSPEQPAGLARWSFGTGQALLLRTLGPPRV
jgi:hypothetical protein